jgi:cephalosporin-C deacetylase
MKKLSLTLLFLISVICVSAQIRGNNIVVTVTPDHKDWNYVSGQKANFIVSVLKSGTLLDNVRVDYEAGPVMYPDTKKTDVLLKNGTMEWSGTMKEPGFYRLKVVAHVDGKDYDGLCTAAFSPEKILPTQQCPADFDSFWSNAIAQSRLIPMEPTKRLLPERCTDKVNVYEVSFQNEREGSRIFGILCMPVKQGSYPALIRVPGAGVRPYSGDVWTASQGAITLEIGIHGIPVTMEQNIYDDLRNGALNNYWTFGSDDKDAFYYKRVFLGALRSIDYVTSLNEWNGKVLGITGSSQGGMLSLVCAALDKRVTFYGAVHAAMCDHSASLKGIACGWPHYFYGVKNPDASKVNTAKYYDGINFAKRIKCNGWFSFGYNDEVVPPTTAYATYNVVTAPKTLSVYQLTGHYWFQEQWDEWENWLLKQMGLR